MFTRVQTAALWSLWFATIPATAWGQTMLGAPQPTLAPSPPPLSQPPPPPPLFDAPPPGGNVIVPNGAGAACMTPFFNWEIDILKPSIQGHLAGTTTFAGSPVLLSP